jgi:hypothetical protein
MIQRWVRFWDQREAPHTLGVIRFLVGLIAFIDFLDIGRRGLVLTLFAPLETGGLADVFARTSSIPLIYQWFPAEPATAIGLYAMICLALFCVMVGFAARFWALVAVLLWAQFAGILPPADRGIDILLRNVLLILACSGAGESLSIDAWRRRGHWLGDGRTVASWPRLLIVFQLILMYTSAGIQKVGLAWTPLGDFSALYIILQDPAIANSHYEWLGAGLAYRITQMGTALTVLWECATPGLLYLFYLQRHPTKGLWLRRWIRPARLVGGWIGFGVIFHLGIALTMRLGIFPWAMLALYPGFLSGDSWRSLRQRASTVDQGH